MRDLRAELEEFDGWPEPWDIQEDPILVGQIYATSTAFGKFGPVNTVLVKTDTGEKKAIWLSHKVLQGKFEDLAPNVGDRVGVKYLGIRTSAGGSDYKDFSVQVDKDADYAPRGGEVEDDGF